MAEPQILRDGTFDFSLGQNSWHSPDRIQPNQYASAVNMSCRGAVLRPRNGYHLRELAFENKTILTKYGIRRTIKDIWTNGKFQATAAYFIDPTYYLITIISGVLFKTDTDTLKTDIISDTLFVNQFAKKINITQAGNALVIHDYPNYPLILDNITLTRADPNHMIAGELQPQVPISTIGTYNQNRLFIANYGTELTAGDPTGSVLAPEAPLTFTEIFTPSSPYVNQVFSLPTEDTSHRISAMGFIQELDQNTGIGPMFVATENNVFFYKTNQPRVNWTQGNFSGLLLANAGIAGQRAFVNVNSDLLFLSAEGQVHALSMARNESAKWGNVPMSREVSNYLKYYDKSLSGIAAVGYFDNRVYITANPYRVEVQTRDREAVSDYGHGGFVVLEIEALATMLTEGTPVWAGLWTGVNPIDIVTVGKRCFIFSKDGEGRYGYNALYELIKDSTVDIVSYGKRRIRSILYTKQYDFEKEYEQKQEHTIVSHLQTLKGHVNYKIERKPSHSSSWGLYGEWEHTAPTESDVIPTDSFVNGYAPHELKHIVFGDAVQDTCNPVTNEYLNTFSATQLRVTIEADDWTLESIKLEAREMPYLEREICEQFPVIAVPVDNDPDWNIPEVDRCEQSQT